MSRTLTAAIVAALTAPIFAAPGPKPAAKDPVYFATTRGAKWVYKFDNREDRVNTVTAVERRADGSTVVTVASVDAGGKAVPYYRVLLAADGLFYLPAEDARVGATPRACRIKLPFRVGDSWDSGGVPRDDGLTTTFRASGTETIKVPAGEFNAIRIDGEDLLKSGEKFCHRTYWFAPDVGLVKSMKNGQEMMVLQSFTPGKE